MKTYEQACRAAAGELAAADVPEAELNAWYLLAAAVQESRDGDEPFTRADYLLRREEALPETAEERLATLVEYRKKRVPLEYITHETGFMGLTFFVDGRVLIPRQDTECLVEEALRYSAGTDVLDLCTGSGCIAVSLAVLGECHSVTATDRSEEALAVARTNAERQNADISFRQGDLFGAVAGMRFDLITCNPPYIPRDVIPTLMPEVREYEPVMALDGGTDGLDFYTRIAAEAGAFLRKNGHLICEIGYDQGEAVSARMCEAGFAEVQVIKDLAGNDRVVTGVWERG